ncbi:MAG: hypothetical protein DRO05_00610 [Thermoproteota archaeon]|nr:MAG: hypothetical protein DRO05_00610 [Candidatus Korarchaeota archaeon]
MQKVKCYYCGEELTYKKLSKPCPYCGYDECWVNSNGECVCLEPIDDIEMWININYKGDEICRACAEIFPHYASHLTLLNPDLENGIWKAQFDEGLLATPLSAAGEQELFGDLDGEIQNAIAQIVGGTKWVKTDPWRGYTQTPEKADGWIMVVDGWHSSLESSPFSDSVQALTKKNLDFPLILVISKTSNVCAIGVSLYYRKRDKEILLRMVDLSTGGVGGIYKVND